MHTHYALLQSRCYTKYTVYDAAQKGLEIWHDTMEWEFIISY